MSKSVSGSRYTLNIENFNLLDLNVRKLTASTDITGSYLTENRVVATDANKKLVSSDITTTELNFLDGVSSNLQTQLGAKQATITAGTNLSFSGNTLNATGGSSTITASRVAVSNSSGAIVASDITTTELNFLDNVSSSLQTQLNSKQATITDGSLSIARTSGLQTSLDAKQATINNSNRVNAVNVGTGIVSNSEFNQLSDINTDTTVQTQLDAKQATILSTSAINKSLFKNFAQSLSSPMNGLSKINNTVVCIINVGGNIPASANQTTVAGYYIDAFSAPNFETLNGLKNTGLVDSSIFTIVAPSYTTATTVSAATGTAARFGIRILSAGLYRATYTLGMENESTNNRISVQSYFRVLFTDSGGTERAERLNSSRSEEYTRDDNFGQYATMAGNAYFEITNDMATNSRGCFLKLNLFCRVGTGESFNSNPNNLIPRSGSIECEKIAELAT